MSCSRLPLYAGASRCLPRLLIEMDFYAVLCLSNTSSCGSATASKKWSSATCAPNAEFGVYALRHREQVEMPPLRCAASLHRLRCTRTFRRQRRRVATKLQNQRIHEITFHTFRHWKATMEYHKTRNMLHVMKMLGHRNIRTLSFTHN
jgi:hypothetical protein